MQHRTHTPEQIVRKLREADRMLNEGADIAAVARHLTITKSLGAQIYFCDSRSPWQRGSNENMNGLLRDYFPKGTDLNSHSPEHLLAVEHELNHRPRNALNDRAPIELFDALLAVAGRAQLKYCKK